MGVAVPRAPVGTQSPKPPQKNSVTAALKQAFNKYNICLTCLDHGTVLEQETILIITYCLDYYNFITYYDTTDQEQSYYKSNETIHIYR